MKNKMEQDRASFLSIKLEKSKGDSKKEVCTYNNKSGAVSDGGSINLFSSMMT